MPNDQPQSRYGEALGIASRIVSRLDTGSYNSVPDKDVKVLADAVILMHSALSESAGWIAVEKALPDNSDPVLVFQGNASHMRRVAYYDTIGATGWRWCGFDSGERCDPDAWMPIPTFSRLSERG